MCIHHPGLHNAFAYRGRHTQVEDKDRNKIKKAAKRIACPGLRTPVETTVAMEFAAS